MKCDKCQYEWENRKPKPKSCPRCKARFDYPKKVTASQMAKNFAGLNQ